MDGSGTSRESWTRHEADARGVPCSQAGSRALGSSHAIRRKALRGSGLSCVGLMPLSGQQEVWGPSLHQGGDEGGGGNATGHGTATCHSRGIRGDGCNAGSVLRRTVPEAVQACCRDLAPRSGARATDVGMRSSSTMTKRPIDYWLQLKPFPRPPPAPGRQGGVLEKLRRWVNDASLIHVVNTPILVSTRSDGSGVGN